MSKHKWLRPRNWNDGPMSAPRKPEPAKCENCGVVIYDTSRFDLESRPCPELVQHIWFYHEDGGDEGFKCACGAWTSSAKPPKTPCSIMFGLKPNMHSGREVQIAPTVIVDARTIPNTSIERQALLDIVELIDNQYLEVSKVYAVVDNNGILAALPWQDEARNYLEYVVSDRDDAMDCCPIPPTGEYYYTAKSNTLYVRLENDFLSLVTLTYINRSK